jgi:hypothetical protein
MGLGYVKQLEVVLVTAHVVGGRLRLTEGRLSDPLSRMAITTCRMRSHTRPRDKVMRMVCGPWPNKAPKTPSTSSRCCSAKGPGSVS